MDQPLWQQTFDWQQEYESPEAEKARMDAKNFEVDIERMYALLRRVRTEHYNAADALSPLQGGSMQQGSLPKVHREAFQRHKKIAKMADSLGDAILKFEEIYRSVPAKSEPASNSRRSKRSTIQTPSEVIDEE